MMIHRRKRSLYRALVGLRMFLWVNPIVLGFWDLKTRSFSSKGIEGIEFCWWRTRPFVLQTQKMKHPAVAPPRVHSQIHDNSSKQATLSSRRPSSTSKSVYLPKNTQNSKFQAQIKLLFNIEAHTISISFSSPKAFFFSPNFFFLFSSLHSSDFLLISQ